MSGRFIDDSGARDSQWSWEGTDGIARRGRKARLVWNAIFGSAFVGGALATAVGVILIATSGSGDAAPPSLASLPTQEPTVVATPAPTASATQTPQPPTPAPTPPPGQQFEAQLLAWSDITSEWAPTALDQGTSGYRAGDFVPLLLRIDGARPGTTYDLQLTYDCVASGEAAIDFLSGIRFDQTVLLQASPGPGDSASDSVLSPLDDPSLDFDNQQDAWFLAWGAAFSRAEGPTPPTACEDTKTLKISVLAQSQTVIVMWSGHLASPADWGEGADAALAEPFNIVVEINGWSIHRLTMLPGSVAQ